MDGGCAKPLSAHRGRDEDWFAWAEEQGERLRAWPVPLRPVGLDVDGLAAELAEAAAERTAQIEGLPRRVVERLPKLEFHPDERSRPGWRKEVSAWRADLEDRLDRRRAPTAPARRAETYAEVWPKGVRLFRLGLREDGHREALAAAERAGLDGAPRHDLDAQVLDPGWFPAPSGEGRPAA